MSIAHWFMEIARGVLPPATFNEIHSRAVAKERTFVEQKTAAPKQPVVSNAVMARVVEHLSNERLPEPPKAHVQERLEKRLGIEEINQGDIIDLLRFIQKGGPNVEITNQRMELMQEVTVNWRGKHFYVVWSKSRNKLITVFAKTKKKKNKLKAGRPRDVRNYEEDNALADN